MKIRILGGKKMKKKMKEDILASAKVSDIFLYYYYSYICVHAYIVHAYIVHARILLEKVRVLESIILKQTAHHIVNPLYAVIRRSRKCPKTKLILLIFT